MKKIIGVSIIILIIDIISKQIILNTMIEHQSIAIINHFFSITFAKNTGVAFSFLEGKILLIIIMTIIILFLILKYIKSTSPNKIESVCYGFVLGGAIGNLIDRFLYGYVIDFLDVNIYGYAFPIFNLADTAIVVGIFSLFILSIIESRS